MLDFKIYTIKNGINYKIDIQFLTLTIFKLFFTIHKNTKIPSSNI